MDPKITATVDLRNLDWQLLDHMAKQKPMDVARVREKIRQQIVAVAEAKNLPKLAAWATGLTNSALPNAQGERIKISHGAAPKSANFAAGHFSRVFHMRTMPSIGERESGEPVFRCPDSPVPHAPLCPALGKAGKIQGCLAIFSLVG
jgi:hypothetical protein